MINLIRTRPRLVLGFCSLILIMLAWVLVLGALSGLEIRRLNRDGVPMLFLVPERGEAVPGILIAHGFGGSKQLMLAYGHVLAHAGYAVLLWDFAGHAANPAPLDLGQATLQQNLDAAYAELIAQPEVNPEQIALLGHSMGSGAVMSAGIRDANRYAAVVAVSPTGAEVTPTEPRNLLLQAGVLEPQFVANAEDLLAAAGGPNDDLAMGRGRAFTRIPGVEHITILFSPLSHQSALAWLDRTFGRGSGTAYRDVRVVWYLVQVAAGTMGLAAAGPWLQSLRGSQPAQPEKRRTAWWLLFTPFLAAVGLYLLSLLGDLSQLGGVMVGGALGVWLLLMGIPLIVRLRPQRLTLASLFWGLLLFVILWLIVGALAQVVWLPWLLIPARLMRWPLLVLCCLPWTVAAAAGQQQQSRRIRLGWWFVQTALITVGLLLTIFLVPGLFVLVLVLPLFPFIIAFMTIVNATLDDPWASGLANALFFAWLLLAYFPLAR